MSRSSFLILSLLFLALTSWFACSDKKSSLGDDGTDGPMVVDTGGISVITGHLTDTAARVLPAVEAHPASPDMIDNDGLMRTRLQGILNPTTSVEVVNNALASASATITFYDTALFSISLRVPELATREAADSLAAALQGTGAFLFLFAGQTAQVSSQSSVSIIPQRPLWTIRHLRKMRMPAAWHVRGLASANSQLVRVIVPDQYASTNPHAEIPSQSFLTGNGVVDVSSTGPNGLIVGNHGFHVAGTIAAAYDNIGSTGAHPGAVQDISVLSLRLGGLGWNEIMGEISQSLPAMPCLVSTSLAYNQLISARSKLQRALDAILWRGLVSQKQNNFLMFSAAGNNGLAPDDSKLSQYSLPWNLAAAYATPDQMVPPGIPVADRQNLNAYFQTITNAVPEAANALSNVVIVGSSDSVGNLSSFSNTPSDVRAVGEDVCAPCLLDDPGLDTMRCRLLNGSTRALYSGTSMATPQVAGLAAYLWNIKPSLTLQQLKTLITASYDPLDTVMPGVIDAYRAVLSLDHDQSDAPVRSALFDVSGSGGLPGSDSKFDEKDLALWFSQFHTHEQNRVGGADPFDYSRYDLNGNGISAIEPAYISDLPQRFDLDVNDPPQFGSINATNIDGQEITYNENAATDLDILCYYAYSGLYTGNEQQRTQLCIPCLGELVVYAKITQPLKNSTPANVEFRTWRKKSAADSLPLRGADLSISVEGATPSSISGITDGSGLYTDQITPTANATSVIIHVSAKLHDVVIAADSISAPVSGGTPIITFLSRTSYGFANAGKLLGSWGNCPAATAADTSGTSSPGSFSFGAGKSFICPDTINGTIEAISSASGTADPGFTSGQSSAALFYDANLSASVNSQSPVTMTAICGHYFTLRFQVDGAPFAFTADAAVGGGGSLDKLNASLTKEGTGTVFVFNGGPGTAPQNYSGILQPGVYTFQATREVRLTSNGIASATGTGTVNLNIIPPIVP